MLVCGRAAAAPSLPGAAKRAGSASRRSKKFVSLRGRDDFGRLYRQGSRFRGQGVVVLTLDGPSALPRVGIVAGRKVGNSVSRNRVKRRLREAAAQAELESGTDYILIAEPNCAQTPIDELIKAISRRDER